MISKDISGLKFNSLTVLKLDHKKKRFNKDGTSKGYIEYWLCLCDCGVQTIVEKSHITTGTTKSCGCYLKLRRKEVHTKHNHCKGHKSTRIYRIWSDMKNRCLNPNNNAYKYYGSRGISVCNEWQEFEPFYQWAINNGYTDNLTIDRINVNSNYEPNNCRWVSMKTQCRNTRKNKLITFKEKTHTLSEWAELYNVNYKMLFKRLKDGWTFEEAITQPKLSPTECSNRNKIFKKVYCNEINKIFKNANEASKYCLQVLNKKVNGISRSCQSSYLKAGGYKWYYYQEPKNV